MSDNLRLVLVRVLGDGWAEVGYTLAHQAVRRPVSFRVRRGDEPAEHTLENGLALIGESDDRPGKLSVEALARQVGRVAIKVDRTPELLWLPVAAHRDEHVGMWTIECVALADWFRVSQRSDAEILRLAGVDAEGNLLDARPCPACGGSGSSQTHLDLASGRPMPCVKCLGTGQRQGMAHE